MTLTCADYIIDASYQGLAYYTMSSLTNDPFKLARMAGYYKGIQSAGTAVSFGIDAVKVSDGDFFHAQTPFAVFLCPRPSTYPPLIRS